jgi:3-deoxy-7-phosphoheptulonate synthase
VQIAIDAVSAAAGSHVFTGVTDDGVAAILSTKGNPDCHVVLRGSSSGPNYDAASVAVAVELLQKTTRPGRVVVDASHGNSGKDHRRQPVVAADLAGRIAAGDKAIAGLMLESFLIEGNQPLDQNDPSGLVYGQSITDACMSWDTSADVLADLAAAAGKRRSLN